METTDLGPVGHSTIGAGRLKAKVAARHAADPGWAAHLIANDLADLDRYAFGLPDRDYVKAVHDAIEAMTGGQGWRLVKFKNQWADPVFKGITTCWYDPAYDHRLEVELHTAWSWHLKSSFGHPLYVCYRDHQPTEAERAEIESTLRGAWRVDDGVPEGAAELAFEPASPPHLPQHMTVDQQGYGYYAAVGRYHSRDKPFALVRRRLGRARERYDEAYTRGYPWRPTSFLLESDHGDTQFDWVSLNPDEAGELVRFFAQHHNGHHDGQVPR